MTRIWRSTLISLCAEKERKIYVKCALPHSGTGFQGKFWKENKRARIFTQYVRCLTFFKKLINLMKQSPF
jgi:hypothetical protein